MPFTSGFVSNCHSQEAHSIAYHSMSLYEIPSFLGEIFNTKSITTEQRFYCVLQRKHSGLRGTEQIARVGGRRMMLAKEYSGKLRLGPMVLRNRHIEREKNRALLQLQRFACIFVTLNRMKESQRKEKRPSMHRESTHREHSRLRHVVT